MNQNEPAYQLTWCPDITGYVSYVLWCSPGMFYKGYSRSFKNRMLAHFTQQGSLFTKGHKPLYIYHYEVFETSIEARRRELFYKKNGTWLRALQGTPEQKAIVPPTGFEVKPVFTAPPAANPIIAPWYFWLPPPQL